jgi:Ca2+-binding RTX toxin-like protein
MNVVLGTAGADFLAGLLKQINEIHGLEDADTIMGGYLGDMLFGNEGDDFIWGDGGDDTIDGAAGYDVLYGGEGNDQIRGDDDGDYISGGQGDDVLDAGAGYDVVSGNSGNDKIDGGAEMDFLFGASGNDTIYGGTGVDDDYLDAGSGDDVLVAGSGSDSYIGGSGFDTIDFSNVDGRVTVDLSKNTAIVNNGGQEFFVNVDSIEKVVLGNGGGNAMGSSADEAYVGGAGDDWFRGKGGADVFTGGEGSDTFTWLKKDVTDGAAADIVTDFEVGVDHMDLTDFVKGGQAWEKVVRLAQTDDGVMVQGNAKGVWVDVALLQGLDINAVGADQHQMTLDDLGLIV